MTGYDFSKGESRRTNSSSENQLIHDQAAPRPGRDQARDQGTQQQSHDPPRDVFPLTPTRTLKLNQLEKLGFEAREAFHWIWVKIMCKTEVVSHP